MYAPEIRKFVDFVYDIPSREGRTWGRSEYRAPVEREEESPTSTVVAQYEHNEFTKFFSWGPYGHLAMSKLLSPSRPAPG